MHVFTADEIRTITSAFSTGERNDLAVPTGYGGPSAREFASVVERVLFVIETSGMIENFVYSSVLDEGVALRWHVGFRDADDLLRMVEFDPATALFDLPVASERVIEAITDALAEDLTLLS